MRTHFVYLLRDPRTKEARYVGRTVNPKLRYTAHKNVRKRTHCSNWVESLRADQLKPDMQLFPLESFEATVEEEKFLIVYLRSLGANLTNLTAGGEGALGRKLSAAAKEKISKANTGAVRPKSPEHRATLSASNKGKRPSDAAIRNSVESRRRNKVGLFDPEVRKAAAAARRGKSKGPMPEEQKKKISQTKTKPGPALSLTNATGEIRHFASTAEAAELLSITKEYLLRLSRGSVYSVFGWRLL